MIDELTLDLSCSRTPRRHANVPPRKHWLRHRQCSSLARCPVHTGSSYDFEFLRRRAVPPDCRITSFIRILQRRTAKGTSAQVLKDVTYWRYARQLHNPHGFPHPFGQVIAYLVAVPFMQHWDSQQVYSAIVIGTVALRSASALTHSADSRRACNLRVCAHGTDSMRVVERIGPTAA